MPPSDPLVLAGGARRVPGRGAAGPFAARCRRLGPALMRDLALTDIQAAGLLGNLGHETGGFAHLQEVAPAVPGSQGGWGLAQWTGPRRRAMEAWCHARGLDPASEAANEGYLCAELRTSEAHALAALRQAPTLDQATEVVCRLFERPGIVALADRLVWARRALAAIRSSGEPAARDPPGAHLPIRASPPRPPSRRGGPRSPPARRPR